MKLLERYKQLSSEIEIFNKYYRCGEKSFGNMFFFKNTNFRYMSTFEENYNIFKQIDGVDRSEWIRNPSYKQENDKHRTVRMFGTKLFSKNERVYYKTEKGNVMEAISQNEPGFTLEEKWLLIYFLILDSYFKNKLNYIIERAQYVIENIIAAGFEEQYIEDKIKEIIQLKEQKMTELTKCDYLYMDTFFQPYNNEIDFLSEYANASNIEKNKLHKYIKNNIATKSYICIISKKFEPSGNYDKKMLVENAKILFMNKVILEMKNTSFKEFVIAIVDRYSEIESIDKGKLINFIFKNRDVFEIIYFNIYGIDYLGIDTANEADGEIEEEKIDDTSIKNVEKLKRISTILKKKAKERTGYKCELEELCGCNNFYFTSKETKKNYLEIHHFIPREFNNEFERSIEVIENYIALCPRCHRMIHLAVDRERKILINAIYNKRRKSLESKGLNVSIKEIEEFYNIEE